MSTLLRRQDVRLHWVDTAGHFSFWVVGGCWSLSQLSLGERQDTPWTGRQSIAGQHLYSSSPAKTLSITPSCETLIQRNDPYSIELTNRQYCSQWKHPTKIGLQD
ncbi:hypothetical protein MHYP_G00353470 [Metynnis hypsauchen]